MCKLNSTFFFEGRDLSRCFPSFEVLLCFCRSDECSGDMLFKVCLSVNSNMGSVVLYIQCIVFLLDTHFSCIMHFEMTSALIAL